MKVTLPEDGDHIRFSEVPSGSPFVADRIYRVERKPGDREILLAHLGSGHSYRIVASDLNHMKFEIGSAEELAKKPEPEAEPEPE